MRTEEMELIIAECQAHTDWQTAKTTVENFVNTYRWTGDTPMYARPHRRMKCSTRYGSSAV